MKEMGWACSTQEREREMNVYRGLILDTEGKRLNGKTTCWSENNIRMGLKESGRDGMGWIHLSQKRNKRQARVNTAINARF
jgi:hypothetical protein